ICVWRLPYKELINTTPNNLADHRHHQRLLMTYTPFATPTLLAQQINVLGTNPGTRIIFWDLRDDLDHLWWDCNEQSIYLSCLPQLEEELSLKMQEVSSSGRTSSHDQEGISTKRSRMEATLQLGEIKKEQSEATLHSPSLSDPTRPIYTEHGSPSRELECLDQADASEEGEESDENEGRDASTMEMQEESLPTSSEGGTDPSRSKGRKKKRRTAEWSSIHSSTAPPAGVEASSSITDLSQSGNMEPPPSTTENLPPPFTNSVTVATRGVPPEEYIVPPVGQLPPTFPLWCVAKHAPDYCLATYLYWLNLHCHASISVQGCPLIPSLLLKSEGGKEGEDAAVSPVNADVPGEVDTGIAATPLEPPQPGIPSTVPTDVLKAEKSIEFEEMATSQPPSAEMLAAMEERSKLKNDERPIEQEFSDHRNEKYTLYNYLKHRLYCMVELKYLFKPSDSTSGCYALIGFLNNPLGGNASRVCEAGICLYYRGRLIRRLENHFPENPKSLESAKLEAPQSLFEGNLSCRYPLTAVINVPDWMIPSVTKQEFMHENNWIFHCFKLKLIKLVKTYLRLCLSPEPLQKWLLKRKKKLNVYEERLRYYQQKQTGRDGSEDEDTTGVRHRSPTPPITHASTGSLSIPTEAAAREGSVISPPLPNGDHDASPEEADLAAYEEASVAASRDIESQSNGYLRGEEGYSITEVESVQSSVQAVPEDGMAEKMDVDLPSEEEEGIMDEDEEDDTEEGLLLSSSEV
ncbi:corepressor complex CRC230, partial [Cardiosporidium cionae]